MCLGIAVGLGCVAGNCWDEYLGLCAGSPLLATLLAVCLGVGLIYLCLRGIGRFWPGQWTVLHVVRDDGTANMLHSRLAG